MVRPTQLLHPQREPVALRPAATVLLLRDTPAGLEVLMTRRSAKASFAPGAYVFPGGGIDAADAQAHTLATRRASQNDLRLTQAIAAIRESFEELGVLLARPHSGEPLQPTHLAALSRQESLFAQCEAQGLRLQAHEVYVFAHWITDRDLPKRFDVPFLVARMPEGQTAVADEAEQFEPVWINPAQALQRHAEGSFFMIFPTIRTLERLENFGDVQTVLKACASEQPLWTSCPRAGRLGGQDARYMEHDLPYGELELVCPDGQTVHALDWQHNQPVPLLKNLQRLTAPNPGMMTGPGTNSYIVGTRSTGYIVIDPGPADDAHVQRLWQACGGDIRAIVCTHSHPDHSPGAAPLQALCAHRPPILGLPSGRHARPNCQFTPERVLQNQERISLSGDDGQSHTLEVIHTPGHAANHVCLALVEDGLLFSGDHILNGSTTVVDPPDGNMSDYLHSLDALDALCQQHAIDFIAPAHGHVMSQARQVIARLKQHRLQREAKVAAALHQYPGADLDQLLPLVYDDAPRAIWPVAKRSLLAHVQRLHQQGVV